MFSMTYKNVLSLSCMLLFTACKSMTAMNPPEYKAPIIQVDDQYKYAELNWIETSSIKDSVTVWWSIYQDPILNQLLQQLNQENLNLKQAEARYKQASALLKQQQASRSVNLTLESAINRSGEKHTSPSNQFNTGIQASWIPDVWGRIAKAIEGQQANLEAVQADLAAVKLNQQLLATEAYWNIRILDAQFDVLKQTQNSYFRSVQILKNQYLAGLIAQADVIQAETQLKQVQIQQIEVQRERNLQENILAVLLGKSAAQFQLEKQQKTFIIPNIPTQLPSRLLIQRPDVIRAERELAMTHAQLGLAKTAWLPDINIGLDGSLSGKTLGALFQAPQYLWSTGVNVAKVIFDGGQRKAKILQEQANYEEKLAAYKQSVLIGWKEVDDALMQSSNLKQQQFEQDHLLQLTRKNEQVMTHRYAAGLVSYLEVVTAQNLRLQAEQTRLGLQQLQLKNTAQLITALGGSF